MSKDFDPSEPINDKLNKQVADNNKSDINNDEKTPPLILRLLDQEGHGQKLTGNDKKLLAAWKKLAEANAREREIAEQATEAFPKDNDQNGTDKNAKSRELYNRALHYLYELPTIELTHEEEAQLIKVFNNKKARVPSSREKEGASGGSPQDRASNLSRQMFPDAIDQHYRDLMERFLLAKNNIGKSLNHQELAKLQSKLAFPKPEDESYRQLQEQNSLADQNLVPKLTPDKKATLQLRKAEDDVCRALKTLMTDELSNDRQQELIDRTWKETITRETLGFRPSDEQLLQLYRNICRRLMPQEDLKPQ